MQNVNADVLIITILYLICYPEPSSTEPSTIHSSVQEWLFDDDPSTSLRGRGRQFDNQVITWRISKFSDQNGLDLEDVLCVTKRAFTAWSNAAPIYFLQLPNISESVDIDFQFFETNYDGDCGRRFARHVLAHCVFDPVSIHFNGNIDWIIGRGSLQHVDLFTTIMHEIGHALGLEHVDVPNTVMFRQYTGRLNGLTNYDIKSIQDLYGEKPSSPKSLPSRSLSVISSTILPSTTSTTDLSLFALTSTIASRENSSLCTPNQFYCGDDLYQLGYRLGTIMSWNDSLYRCYENGDAFLYNYRCYKGNGTRRYFPCTPNWRYCGYELRSMNLIYSRTEDHNMYRCDEPGQITKIQNCSRCWNTTCLPSATNLCSPGEFHCGYELTNHTTHSHFKNEAIYYCNNATGNLEFWKDCVDGCDRYKSNYVFCRDEHYTVKKPD